MGPRTSAARILVLGVVALIATGCGASSTDAASGPDGPATAPSSLPFADPTDRPADAPAVLALADDELELGLEGDSVATVVAGETVELNHLLYNRSPGTRSVTFRIQDAALDVDLSLSSARVGAQEVLLFTSVITVPENAAVGESYSYRVNATVSTDVDQQASMEIRLVVSEAGGTRPSVVSTRASTETNQKLVVYVLTAASDPDNDIDFSSLRIVAGGFKSAGVSASADGTITYLPFQNVTGDDVVLYELCDAEGRCTSGALGMSVRG